MLSNSLVWLIWLNSETCPNISSNISLEQLLFLGDIISVGFVINYFRTVFLRDTVDRVKGSVLCCLFGSGIGNVSSCHFSLGWNNWTRWQVMVARWCTWDHCNPLTLLQVSSAGQSFQWFISTSTWWMSMKSVTDTHGSQTTHPNDLIFPLQPPQGSFFASSPQHLSGFLWHLLHPCLPDAEL